MRWQTKKDKKYENDLLRTPKARGKGFSSYLIDFFSYFSIIHLDDIRSFSWNYEDHYFCFMYSQIWMVVVYGNII